MRNIVWAPGQRLICVSVANDDRAKSDCIEVGTTLIYRHTVLGLDKHRMIDGEWFISFEGHSYVHPEDNFISFPDEIQLRENR